MNIVVTGGAGYIGSHTVKALLDLGHKVYVIDNFCNSTKSSLDKRSKLLDVELDEVSKLSLLFKKYKIDAVMHFAAFKAVGESVKFPLNYYHNNVSMTINLLKAMNLANIKYFIFSSSAAVYGQPEMGSVTEDAPLRPINPYGKSKKMIEVILKDISNASEFRYVALRYFNVAGYDKSGKVGAKETKPMNLIPIIVDAITTKKDINVFGDDYPTKDGTPIRDYIHVTDLVDAHIKALNYLVKNNKSEVFNLGTNKGYSVKDILSKTEKTLKIKLNPIYGPRRIGDPAILVANASKAKKLLKWTPKMGLDEMISSTHKVFTRKK